ncbi:CMP-N-acetylneuraminate-beta-galactosamide-alpha-2, 3-sialyltransferase [Pasteurellaceae bacterium RH1A]|nr:CMP-N-acetylneuraminate-beta-galactosamide-alpha-2, 3-sialyltransferase [Pasteurellaceae bacterium RH1A]
MNLIICCTPLQVLIAEKIIDLHPKQAFFGVVLSTVSNKKFDYYKERLAQKCAGFFSMVQLKDRKNLLKQILLLKKKFKGKQFDQVFVANLNELQIQFLLSAISFKQLNTLDDGTANIIQSSILYQPEPNGWVRKLTNCCLGNKYSLEKLKAISQKHYTLYAGLPNIIANTQFVNIMPNLTACEPQEEIALLLGQPLFDEDKANIELAEKVVKAFNINHYLPHPREKYQVQGVTYIDTPYIFEDYLAQECKNKRVRVYTYISSAVLNVMNNPNVEIIALKVETDVPAYQATYKLFEQMGINIVNIEK